MQVKFYDCGKLVSQDKIVGNEKLEEILMVATINVVDE